MLLWQMNTGAQTMYDHENSDRPIQHPNGINHLDAIEYANAFNEIIEAANSEGIEKAEQLISKRSEDWYAREHNSGGNSPSYILAYRAGLEAAQQWLDEGPAFKSVTRTLDQRFDTWAGLVNENGK